MYENRHLISNWDILRLILAIDRQGGVSGAARFMGVTHATISRRLARAEDHAGAAFFERLPAGLRLTEAGRAVLAHATRIEPEINSLERQLMAHEDGLSGPLRVTIPPLMLTAALSRDIAQFAAAHPEVKIEFVGDNNLLNLHQREADVAIRVTRRPPETLWGRKLTDQHAGYYASTDWLSVSPLRSGGVSGDIPLISFASWPTPIPKILQQVCPNVRIVARSDDMATALQMVQAGLGLTRVPRILGDSLGGLSLVRSLPKEIYAPIWLLTHPDLRKNKRVEAFMTHVSTRIRARRKDYIFPGLD
ncbi:MAG: LysR family transcriptional regulator [Geminicoccales bacterium]